MASNVTTLRSLRSRYLLELLDQRPQDPEVCRQLIRALTIEISELKRTPHIGSTLSCTDILVAAHHLMYVLGELDEVVLSKGHAALGLYCSLANHGVIPFESLLTYASEGSNLEEHPNPTIPGVTFPTGALGHGLGLLTGRILGKRIQGQRLKGVVIMSDGECNEGSVWEAALFAQANKISGLVAVIDNNGWQATARTSDTFGNARLVDMFKAFGWNGVEADGHDHKLLAEVIREGLSSTSPFFVVANTIKGKGVDFMEDDNNWHYRVPTSTETLAAIRQLENGLI